MLSLRTMGPERLEDIMSLETSQLESLGIVFNSVISMLLGFCIYGRLTTLKIDCHFLKELFGFRRVIALITRTVYFISRYLCIAYLISQIALIDGRRHVACTPISVFIVTSFYLLLLCNHWLFTSRLIAVWHGHAQSKFVLIYVAIGYTVLFATVVLNFSDSQYGIQVKDVGCLYLVNWMTYPKKAYQIALCVTGLLFHTTNMMMAVMRLASFRHTAKREVLDSFSLRAFGCAIVSVFAIFGRNDRQAQQRRSLAQDLIEQGFHYWAARTVLVSTLVFLPSFAFAHSTLAATIGFASFTVADVELSGLLYRATVSASRRPSLGALNTIQTNEPRQGDIAPREGEAHCFSDEDIMQPTAYREPWITRYDATALDASSESQPRRLFMVGKPCSTLEECIDVEKYAGSPVSLPTQSSPPSLGTIHSQG